MTTISLAAHQVRYDLRTFLRDPRARMFTLAMPVLFLLLFGTLFRHSTFTYPGYTVTGVAYYVPHIIALGVTGAALANLVLTVVAKREAGALKRRRATPVRAWVLIGSDATISVLSALCIAVVLIAIGWGFYGVRTDAAGIGAAAASAVLGAAALCALGYAVSTFIPSVESAGPAIMMTTFLLYALSGLYFPDSLLPVWLRDVAEVLPVRPLAVSLQAAFVPASNHGSHFAVLPLAELAVWGVAATALASWRFSWAPKGK